MRIAFRNRRSCRTFLLAVAFSAAVGLAWAQTPVPAYVAAAIASTDRPKIDTDRDAARKPGELLAYAGLKPGDMVADIIPGQGYFTRIFSKAVGANGRVFALIPPGQLLVQPKAADPLKAIAAEPGFANVTVLTPPPGSMTTPAPVDIAWTSNNYHDLYNAFGAEQAAKFDAAVFKMVKPGGVFIVIDHVAKPGTSAADAKTWHRIDPEIVKAQVIAAGFNLESQSSILTNPADLHDAPVFAPTIRGRSDQFVMKFRKPIN